MSSININTSLSSVVLFYIASMVDISFSLEHSMWPFSQKPYCFWNYPQCKVIIYLLIYNYLYGLKSKGLVVSLMLQMILKYSVYKESEKILQPGTSWTLQGSHSFIAMETTFLLRPRSYHRMENEMGFSGRVEECRQ